LEDTLHSPALKSGEKTIVLSAPQSPAENPVPVSLQIVMGDPYRQVNGATQRGNLKTGTDSKSEI
jgi:hypothetical protein